MEGTHCFPSRPRRFGKSRLLDTLKALFEGLHAEAHRAWSVKPPVLRLSFGAGVRKTAADLGASLHKQLSAFEALQGLPAEVPDARARFPACQSS
ncbi:MAG: AAA family ATPase [Candidatus Sericytochromatia bacterium]|nr:AAA family ATPase [Candidatus Sericytochromatia bacterium]